MGKQDVFSSKGSPSRDAYQSGTVVPQIVDRETDRQRQRQRGREREAGRQTETERERATETETDKARETRDRKLRGSTQSYTLTHNKRLLPNDYYGVSSENLALRKVH